MSPLAHQSAMMSELDWATIPHMQDRFIEGHKAQVPRRFATRISASDESMPDYSHSITPRSSRDPSLHDIQNVHGGAALQQESQFEELMAAFSPAKTSGTQAPPTTRVSSATNSPPMILKTSGDPEVRITSFHGQPRAVSMTTREAPPSSARAPSDVSMKSRCSEPQTGEKEKAHPKIKVTPASEVKSRKEGKGSELGLSKSTGERKVSTGSNGRSHRDTTSRKGEQSASKSDSKRKRASLVSMTNLLSENSEEPESSPSRKVSKRGRQDGLDDSAHFPKSPESVVRAPLGLLQNIR